MDNNEKNEAEIEAEIEEEAEEEAEKEAEKETETEEDEYEAESETEDDDITEVQIETQEETKVEDEDKTEIITVDEIKTEPNVETIAPDRPLNEPDTELPKSPPDKLEWWQNQNIIIPIGIALMSLMICILLVVVFSSPRGGHDFSITDEAEKEIDYFEDETHICMDIEDTREAANKVLQQLLDYDGDDFDSFFNEMMIKHSEDPGSHSSPNGYLFQKGMMVDAFYETAKALSIGEISGLVETSFGFHIIYRIPINPDEVPSAAASQGDSRSLRTIMAMEELSNKLETWIDDFEPEYTKEFESLDLTKMIIAATTHDSSGDSSDEPLEISLDDIDFDAVFKAYEPDTTMIIAGDYSTTWAELFTNIFRITKGLYLNLGFVPDFSKPYIEDMGPLGELILESATEEATIKLTLLYNASRQGIELSREDLKNIDDHIKERIEYYGSEEEFLEYLWTEQGIHSIELYRELSMYSFMPYISSIFRELYGENAELFPTDEVLKRAEADGFIMAKHILFRFTPCEH